MKQTWKKIVSLAVMMVLALSMTACGSQKEEINASVAERLYQGSVSTVQTLVGYDTASMEQAIAENPDMDDFVKTAFQSWMDSSEELGAFKAMEDQTAAETVKLDSHKYIVTLNAEFENRDAVVELVYDSKLNPESVGFSPNYSMGEKMKSAGVNTVIGILTVFLMLLFLSFVISLMRYVPKLEAALTKKKPEEPRKAAPAPVPAAPVVEEELMDDNELIAVIAAAIAASENTSTDGFVVRSIRKVNKRNNWR